MLTTPSIVPAVLETTFTGFSERVKTLEPLFSYIHIDVMDGQFVTAKSFSEIEKVTELKTSLKFELHLMVNRPIAEMERWAKVRNVFRVIFHAECEDSLALCIAEAKLHGWEAGIALNPETPLEAVDSFFEDVAVIQCMTVQPGRQGAPLVPSVLKKIREFTALTERPLCAVDGGVNGDTILEFKNAGVDIVNVGSALTLAPNVGNAYQELKNICLI